MVITRKIELHIDKGNLSAEEYNQQWHILHAINNNLYKVANRLINKLYLNSEIDTLLYLNNNEYIELRKQLAQKNLDDITRQSIEQQLDVVKKEIQERRSELMQRSLDSLAYSYATNENEAAIYGQILSRLSKEIAAHYLATFKEVKDGKRSLSNYRQGMPIPFPFNKSLKLVYEDGTFYLKWYNKIRFTLDFGRDRSNNRLIVQRCLGISDDGVVYKAANSSIQIKKQNGIYKIFLLLCVDIPNEKKEVTKGKIVGIDLGLNVPIYAAVNNGPERKSIGSRESFLDQRAVFQRRFRSLQRLELTKGGRGRAHKLEPLERLREAERNWVKNQNHLLSKEVVDFAKQVQAAIIQMEHLKNFGHDRYGNSKEDKKYVLRNWSYFELQTMIEYKAKRAGIKVVYVNPAYTSQYCSECGMPGERTGIHFMCSNPECKCYEKDIHADYNGARNIAKSKDIIK